LGIRRFILSMALTITILISTSELCQSATENSIRVMELNFVFLHGFNGDAGSLQLLKDSINEQLPAYITNYRYDHPDIEITTEMLCRSYPNNVDIDTWANNIADSINTHMAGKKNIILIGHSMGGKTALYSVAHNTGNIAEKVPMVVTINSPVKSLSQYNFVSGDTALDFWGAQFFLTSKGALDSLVNYDCSPEAKWVGTNKKWLACISAEANPVSSQFDTGGIDTLPRNMDDSIVPLSCQYTDEADVVYYGQYEHGDFTKIPAVSSYLTNQILQYIFGGNVECSSFSRSGFFEHKADLFPGTDRWQDLVGGVLSASGTVMHQNNSFFKWQEWEDIVGGATSETNVKGAIFSSESPGKGIRSSFQTMQKNSTPFFTGIIESRWLTDDPQDGRIYLRTRAAPRSSVQVDWSVYEQGLLPSGLERDHYEVEIESGAQFTRINDITWETSDPRDLRLRISSEAQSPFRWFKAQWKVYYKESRNRQLIDSLPLQGRTK